jgi:DNA polymerase (family 10)
MKQALLKKGINTLPKLRKNIASGAVTVPAITNLDLNYDIKRKFPRKIADVVYQQFSGQQQANIILVGSYRRDSAMLGDIDLLLHTITISSLIKTLREKGNDIKVYTDGLKKKSYIIKPLGEKSYYKMDIFLTNPENMSFALLHYTGDKITNMSMRSNAKKKGYKLNQYGLFKKNTKIKGLTTEKKIFEFLGLSFKEPKDRTHTTKKN